MVDLVGKSLIKLKHQAVTTGDIGEGTLFSDLGSFGEKVGYIPFKLIDSVYVLDKQRTGSLVWGLTPVISALRRLRQED